MSADQFDEIYGDTDPALKAAKDRPTLVNELHQVREKYGQF
jgi:hypothetical protein